MDADPDETNALITKLFYLMTIRLEDAAGAAAQGQGRRVNTSMRVALAERVRAAGQEVAIIAEALGQLLSRES